jgi:hypothetical protein
MFCLAAPALDGGSMSRKSITTNQAKSPSTFSSKGFFLKDSRGDKTGIELFIAGVRGWEAGLRRRLDDGELITLSR